MGRLLDQLICDFQRQPPATLATLATLNEKTAPVSQESQESQGVQSKKRTWAQHDADGWHGIAVGPGWWQWCGKFRTLHEALQAAEQTKD